MNHKHSVTLIQPDREQVQEKDVCVCLCSELEREKSFVSYRVQELTTGQAVGVTEKWRQRAPAEFGMFAYLSALVLYFPFSC